MSALAIFALAMWLVRVAIDSDRADVVIPALIAVPVAVAAAVGRLFGNAIIAALGYWMLAMLAIGIGAIAKLASL
jgi:hypothetical protein